jgi:ABC-type transport system involved in multi-copper enzyme maturation permease subunit
MIDSWLAEKLPFWAHPRSPLVAISLRAGGGLWEYRINRMIDFILAQMFSLWVILFVFLPIFGAFIFAAGRQFFSLVTFAALTLSAPLMVIASEVLFLRLWLATPVRSSDLIAGEIQRRTWDIIRSTPYPRHQLVLAKFAALGWMAEPTLIYIIVMRAIFISGLFSFRFLQQPSPAGPGWIIWALSMWAAPVLEIFAVFSIGIFVSSTAHTPRQANLLSLISQAGYRLLTIALMIGLFVDLDSRLLAPTIAFPHWTLLPLGRSFMYSGDFLLGVVFSFLMLPLIVGVSLLWLTVQRVQNQ